MARRGADGSRSRRGVWLATASIGALLVLTAVGPGAADPVGDGLTPSNVELTLGVGASDTVSSSLHLTATPPDADVILAVDTTGSMGGAIANAQADAAEIVSRIRGSIPTARFAVVDFKDYDFSPFGGAGDYPYLRRQALTGNTTAIQNAVNVLTASGGGDGPEAYNRVIHESYSDANLGRNANVPGFLVVLGDQLPHDAGLSTDFASCPNTPPTDPGPDATPGNADDLTTVQVTRVAKSNHINVSTVLYNNPTTSTTDCWSEITAYTGGQVVTHTGTSSLADQIVNLINEDAAKVDQVDLTVSEGYASWVSFTPPPKYGPFTAPIDLPFDMTVTVPPETLPGDYTFSVHAVADGAVRADRSVTVHVQQVAVSSLSLTADQRSNVPGLSAIPFSQIPAARIPAFAGNAASTPGGSIPGGSIPGGSIPGGSIPGGSIPGGSIAFGDIGFGVSTPGGSIPGGSIPGGSIGLQRALQSVLLSQVPLLNAASGATWQQVLASPSPLAGRALNTLTLYDVATDTTAWNRMRVLPLRDVPFATSLWGGVPVAAWLLGNAPLSVVPVPAGYSSWAAALDGSGGSSTGLDPTTNTVFGVGVAGQLGHTDIGSIPGGSIPGGSIPGGSIPAREIFLTSLNIAGSRLASVALSDISPLADIVNCSPNGTFDCTGKSLAQAAAASAIKPSATFGMLLDRLPTGHPAKQMTLSELIFAFLPASLYPWEQLNVQGLQDVAGTGQNVDYHVDFDLDCAIATGFSVTVDLPPGEFPVTGSTSFAFGNDPALPALDPALDGESRTTWTAIPAGVCAGQTSRHVRMSFSAYEGLTLGEHTASARVVVLHQTTQHVDNQAPVLVAQAGEPNDDPSTARPLTPNTLYVGHIGSAGDIDASKFSISGLAPGTKVTAYLKVPSDADLDLVLRKPAAPGVRSNPGGSIPGGSIPIEDLSSFVDNSSRALPPDTLSDVAASIPGGSIPGGSIPGGSIPGGSIPGGSISANRGATTESAQIVTAGEAGDVILDVSGYNGAHSTQPYVLRIKVTPPPPLPNCPVVTGLGNAAPGALPSPASLPSDANTLFLVNRQRMVGLYGAASIDALLNGPSSPLNLVAARAEVKGTVLAVDGSSAVRAAYAAWDAAPCSIPAVNGVVRSINDLVDTYRAARPNLKYVVLLGTDEVIPFWRQLDRVAISPEVDEAGELAFTTNELTAGNPIYAAAAQNYFLTDGAYGVRQKITWLGSDLPLPQDSVSRFVESPEDIGGQLQEYLDANGTLNPQSELTTGDDFFADSASAANNALGAGFPGIGQNTLFPPTQAGWNKADLINQFFGKISPGVPDIGALYAHYNPWLAQPAGPSPFTSLSQMVSTADVPTSTALARKILFTIGCHAGLNIPDTYFGDAVKKNDWAGRYAKARAATYIANNGFGYDDTESIALSGRLMWLFSQKLNRGTGSIGEQWLDAVNSYYLTAGDWDLLDEKVMLQATFYGPPWSHFQTTTPAPPSTPPTTHADGSLQVASITLSPTVTEHDAGGGKSSWNVDGRSLSVEYRSIQPLVTRPVTRPGQQARDAFITSLAVHDLANKTPVRAYPTIERSAYEPNANFPNIFWPASPVTVLHSPLGDELNVIAGQFRPNPGQTELGTERLVDSIGVDIAYSNATDITRPSIKQVGAVMTSNSAATLFVRVTDESSPLSKVAALYNDGVTNFRYQQLTFVSGDLWTAQVTGLAGPVEVIGEARDSAGNVGLSANKAVNFTAIADTTAPEIVIDTPIVGGSFTPGQQVPARYTCSDGGGVAACAGPVAPGGLIDTASLGTHTFTVNATDLSGHNVSKTATYYVRYGFLGFYSPVDNLPALNIANAGSTIPVRWRLRNASGEISTLAAITSISSKRVRCPDALGDPIEDTVSASLMPLKYTGGQYVYTWKTPGAWAGQCRRLFVAFSDDTYRAADFRFR